MSGLSYSQNVLQSANDAQLADPAGQEQGVLMEPQLTSTRVCDRCMVKKIKCNLKRPACSRCVEEDTPCVYSSLKRKPGPIKGSRRKKSTATVIGSEQAPLLLAAHARDIQTDVQNSLSIEDFISQRVFEESLSCLTTSSIGSVGTASSFNPGSNYEVLPDPQLQPTQELQLLDNFFTYVQPSMPLFNKDSFMQRYEEGSHKRDLLLTVLAVSAKIQGPATIWTSHDLHSCLEYLLIGKNLENNLLVTLEDYQQACLLAFYEFHQTPGQKSWQRISHLTRKAYQCGLHQIDNRDFDTLLDFGSMRSVEVEEWRCLWWCIYCLDSYCNITAATPFVIEIESVRTALVMTSQPDISDSEEPIFLPAETELLWKTSKDITSRQGDVNLNMHIVTTTLLKEAATLARLWRQNPSDRLRARFTALDNHLAAVRLALPTRYLTVQRDVLLNEGDFEHHARLICILHLHAARILISLPVQLQKNEAEWLQRWQTTLEYCEDVVSVVRQWKPQLSLSVDPAICFIISAALTLLHLHSKDVANVASELQTRLRTSQNLLLLFLEHFASIWHLPCFLIASFHELQERYSTPLTPADIAQILARKQGVVYQNWFKFLSLNPEHMKPPASQSLGFTALPDSDYDDWESWLNASSMSELSQAQAP